MMTSTVPNGPVVLRVEILPVVNGVDAGGGAPTETGEVAGG